MLIILTAEDGLSTMYSLIFLGLNTVLDEFEGGFQTLR